MLEKEKLGADVMDRFFHLFWRNVIETHEAYLFIDLVEHMKEMSEAYALAGPPITQIIHLKDSTD